jgi:hypothetical protein
VVKVEDATMEAVEVGKCVGMGNLFHFDKVFLPQHGQDEVFDEVKPFI